MSKMYLHLGVKGVTAPDDTQYYVISDGYKDDIWSVSRKALHADPKRVFRELAEQGMSVPGAGFVAQVLEEACRVHEFLPREIVSNVGWTGPVFARGDGRIFQSKQSTAIGEPPLVAFRREPERYVCEGSLSSWRRKVAEPLTGDAAVNVVFGLGFAPIIRNVTTRSLPPFAIQLVTEQRGLRTVALSALGSSSRQVLSTDPIESVIREPRRFIEASRDGLLLLDDVRDYLSGDTGKKRPAAVRALINDHLLPSGGGEANTAGVEVPCVLLIEREPIAVQLGMDADAVARLNEVMVTVNIAPSALEGLDSSVDRDRTPDAVWKSVRKAAKDHCGVPLYQFQRAIVKYRAKAGLNKLEAEIDGDIDQFHAWVENKYGEAAPRIVVELFALTYAALRAAERLGVIPHVTERQEAVWRVFKLAMAEYPHPPSAADILVKLAAHPGVRYVDDLTPDDSEVDLGNVPAFIKICKGGERELWITTDKKKRVFDWPRFKELRDFPACFVGRGEKNRDGEKRNLGGWRARVLRFHLPDLPATPVVIIPRFDGHR